MKPVPASRRPGALCAALLLVLASAPERAAAQAALAVAPAAADPALAPIARGFDRWLADALADAGLAPAALPAPGLPGLAAAAAEGHAHALLARLRERDGRVTVQLTLHATGDETPQAAGRGEAPLDAIGDACSDALGALAGALGVHLAPVPPQVGELASATRALELAERGRLYDAWRAVQGKLSPVALATRKSIVEAAGRPGAPREERARVLAASGDVASAWGLVGGPASIALREGRGDAALMVAAAEVQLANQNPRQALRYLLTVRGSAADAADVQLALARARLAVGDRGRGRASAERAAKLAPHDPDPVDLLMRTDAHDPKAGALHALEAARRSALQLEPGHARRHLKRVVELDPTLAPQRDIELGRLEARVGRPARAIAAYRRAAENGADGADVQLGLGRALRASGDADGAEASLRRAAELAPRHAPAIVELGALLADTGRPDEAVPLLREARELAVPDERTNLTLARALRLTGANSDAVEVLMEGGDVADVRELRELAAAQRAAGDLAAARRSLERAVDAEPQDPGLREQLATLLEAAGDASGADAERALASLLGGGGGSSDVAPAFETARRVDFDAMVATFAERVPQSHRRPVHHLGVRHPNDWRTWWWRLSRPVAPDRSGLGDALREAIGRRFSQVTAIDPEVLDVLSANVDQLFAFDTEGSLSAEAIARLNTALGTEGVFATRLFVRPDEDAEVRCDAGTFALETRLLLGTQPRYVQILATTDCVAGGVEAYGTWNAEAFGAYALLALLLGFPLLRGWGTLLVRIRLPEKTKGYFSIHITTKPGQVKRQRVDKKTCREKIRSKRHLDFLRRYERHMAGRETRFRMIPARKGAYTVTVGGPLLDARGEEIIGHFLEEQRVRVQRGGLSELDFDFRPSECAVEVEVLENGRPAAAGRVAIAGDPSSLRYARDGKAYLYLGKGDYTVLVGTKSAAAEFPVQIARLDAAVPVNVDFADCDAVLRNCPAAVEPFLIGDLATAAGALESAGEDEAAARVRARLARREGRAADAARELETVGELADAASLRAEGEDHAGSATLYEQAGDLANAAAAHREAGEFEAAARCFEEVYDYGNALECWREVGNEEKEIELLEKLGEYVDAAELAHARGDHDRAIANLQQVDARHHQYGHTRRRIAEIVAARGDYELAVAKFEEAIEPVGVESASQDMLESFAETLVNAGQPQRAVELYETIQRRDVARTDLTPRIHELRAALSAAPADAADTAARESRYELLEEIGRGGMGVVYKARDKRLGRVVALKRLPENLREHPNAVALFEREARAAAALNHANIVTLFDAGEEDGSYFITMELLQGRALNEVLRRRPRLSVRDTARLGVQIATGLHYAHAQRIVHRDIKTANLFFTRDQVLKIMDFGIAKSLEEVRRSTTVVGGTPYYMAPEQATGEGVDHRADLYAFGVTLFELATGALPYADGDVTYRHAHEPTPDPRELQADLPELLARLVLDMLAKRPEDRPTNAAEIAERLRRVLAEAS